VLVLKDAVEHQEFLSSGMRVAREGTAGFVAHNGCRTRLFRADPEKHPPIDACCWAGNPSLTFSLKENRLGEIIVDAHVCTPKGRDRLQPDGMMGA
jgi:hypothetical protein